VLLPVAERDPTATTGAPEATRAAAGAGKAAP
jgi:hypothetical protein